MNISCSCNQEEFALISAMRESGMSPVAVMIGTRNGFMDNNDDRRWDETISIWDRYIQSLISHDDDNFE
ncbi:hypothetical protein M3664_04855 [Paenibacillus lautus]|uniref:hypothetical protein n=1 Tax=Paenibacillus lautus TaxID=1401 RepID=UPI00203BA093|nr:hypothetical protein [Paenibacillus lautus]MCM3257112.1 hypothetical protein [Paenibacillus lautus]